MPPGPTLSVVVPVYNGETTLRPLAERVAATLAVEGSEYELLLVNDGSGDGSWQVIEQLAAQHSRVRGIDLMRNYGQHNALLAGIRASSVARIVTIDDDLQNPPEEIPKLLAQLDRGFDVVYGAAEAQRYGFLRGLATRVTKWALREMIGREAADVSAFRAFRGELVSRSTTFRGPYVSIDVLLSWGARRFGSVRVAHDARAEGRSRYTFGRLATHALRALAELRRVVRPGGGVVLLVPQHPRLWSAMDDVAHHVRRYTRRELVAKTRSVGLEVVQASSFVSILLPAMVASRAVRRRYDPLGEFVPGRLNGVFERVLEVERWLIVRGVSLPSRRDVVDGRAEIVSTSPPNVSGPQHCGVVRSRADVGHQARGWARGRY